MQTRLLALPFTKLIILMFNNKIKTKDNFHLPGKEIFAFLFQIFGNLKFFLFFCFVLFIYFFFLVYLNEY